MMGKRRFQSPLASTSILFFSFCSFHTKGKSRLNCHCILALDPLGRSLIPALIQSHNNGGEIPLQAQQTSCLCCEPTQSNTNLVFHNIAALPPPFLFQKGRIHQKGNISVLPPVCALYIHFISQYHYKIQSRPIPFAIDFIQFIFCWVFKTSHTENHLLTNHFSITLVEGHTGFYQDNYCQITCFIIITGIVRDNTNKSK